jgi:hypothetical protein
MIQNTFWIHAKQPQNRRMNGSEETFFLQPVNGDSGDPARPHRRFFAGRPAERRVTDFVPLHPAAESIFDEIHGRFGLSAPGDTYNNIPIRHQILLFCFNTSDITGLLELPVDHRSVPHLRIRHFQFLQGVLIASGLRDMTSEPAIHAS